MRLYRAYRAREKSGITSKALKGSSGKLIDYNFLADAMYSHEMPSHILHNNELLYSWTPSFEIAKQFYAKGKGTGGYEGIAYIDVEFGNALLPENISDEILFAYPLVTRKNWIDMIILREYHNPKKILTCTLDSITFNNLNYKVRKKPYLLSNLLYDNIRNGAYKLSNGTQEFVLITKNLHFNVIHDIDAYEPPIIKVNYEGITNWLILVAKKDAVLQGVITEIMKTLEADIDFYESNNLITKKDLNEIKIDINYYKKMWHNP